MYGWRAHRQRLTAIAAHPNELLVATAGRGHVGGQDQEVVRCWNLADTAAGDMNPSFSSCASSSFLSEPHMMLHGLCYSWHVNVLQLLFDSLGGYCHDENAVDKTLACMHLC